MYLSNLGMYVYGLHGEWRCVRICGMEMVCGGFETAQRKPSPLIQFYNSSQSTPPIMDGKIAVSTLKAGHSLSLNGHTTTVANTVGPRSALLCRAQSTPKLPIDTSYESVQENINRKILHSHIYSANPDVFKRF